MMDMTWEFSVFQINNTIATVTVQTFFALRIYSLSNNIILGVLVELFVVVQCAFGIAFSVLWNRTPGISDFVDRFRWVVVVWLAFRAAADLIICFYHELSLACMPHRF